MLRFILYSAALAALLYTAVIYASSPLAILVFAGVLLMAAAYLYLAAACCFIRCSIALPIGMTEQNQPVDIEIVIENRSFLPIAKAKICAAYQMPLAGKKGNIWLYGMADSFGKTIIKSCLMPEECGGYRLYLRKIKIYDLTGFFCLAKYQKKHVKQLYVMPKITEYEIFVTEASRNSAGGADDCDDFQIRPFRNGDKPQSIHWKMSAKAEELMVREKRLSPGCSVLLFLDVTGKAHIKERFYELVCSISYSLVSAHCPHFAIWYSSREKDMIRVRVEDEENLYCFMLMLFEEEADDAEWDIMALYCEKYGADVWGTDIFVNRECMVKVNGRLLEKPEEEGLVI